MKFIYETLMLTTAFLSLAFMLLAKAIPMVLAVLIILKVLVYKFPLTWTAVVLSPVLSFLVIKIFSFILNCVFVVCKHLQEKENER